MCNFFFPGDIRSLFIMCSLVSIFHHAVSRLSILSLRLKRIRLKNVLMVSAEIDDVLRCLFPGAQPGTGRCMGCTSACSV